VQQRDHGGLGASRGVGRRRTSAFASKHWPQAEPANHANQIIAADVIAVPSVTFPN
jgi:hypothetical protein